VTDGVLGLVGSWSGSIRGLVELDS